MRRYGSAIVNGRATAFVLVNLVVTAFFGALWAVISAVGYHDLRVAKEGIDDED